MSYTMNPLVLSIKDPNAPTTFPLTFELLLMLAERESMLEFWQAWYLFRLDQKEQPECLGLAQTRPKEYLMQVGKEFYDRRVGCCYNGVHRVLRLMVVQEISMKGKVWG
jgi:hypothetical protein